MADVEERLEFMESQERADDIIPKNSEELAELKKENGNQLYKIKQYRSALTLYTEAIQLCPESTAYYANRSACLMMLNRFEEALEDSRKCVQLDPNFNKGYLRMLKCALALGDVLTAEHAVIMYKQLEAQAETTGVTLPTIEHEVHQLNRLKALEPDAKKAYDKKDFRKVVFCMDRCLDIAPNCTRFKVAKAECLAFLGRYLEAQDIVNTILHLDRGNADAIYVRGVCLFYEDNVDSAFQHFQQVLRLAPDHKKALTVYKSAKLLKQKKEQGNEAYKNNRFAEAVQLYTEALQVDPLNKKTNAKLYFNRATALSRLSKTREALEDCTAALNLDETYLKALLRRAKCHSDLGEFEEAVRDYEQVCKMDKSRENKRLLQDAKMALKRSKRKDYYKILGVERTATDDEIKKAYRKRALVHHPDRHANASETEKKEQERRFKEVGEAYGVLSDPKKKIRYDNGQDMEEMGGMDVDPTQVFQSFFPGGGTEFSFNNGFPGGFSFQFG